MNVIKEVLDNCEVLMTVEVDEERKAKLLQNAARRISKGVKIPGFRPGKAPYNYVLNRFGIEALQEEAMEELTKEVFQEALKTAEVTPFALGALDSVTWEPLVMKVKIPVAPVVELGDYKNIRLEMPEVEISDDKVAKQLEEMRDRYATYTPVDRPAQMGDLVTVTITQKDVDSGEILVESEEQEVRMVENDEDEKEPDLVSHLLDMVVGQETTFTYVKTEEDDDDDDDEDDEEYDDDNDEEDDDDDDEEDDDDDDDDDDEEEEDDDDDDEEEDDDDDGIKIEATLKVNAIKAREMPELNDEFAAQVGDYDSLDALKSRIKEGLLEQEQHQAEHKMIDQIIDQIISEAKTIKWPQVLEEEELNAMMENQANRMKRFGVDLDTILKYQNKTRETLREEMREGVKKNIRRSLVLNKVSELEKVTVEAHEIMRQVEAMVNYSGGSKEALRTFQSPAAISMLANDMLEEKTGHRLLAIAKGEAETPAEAAGEAPADEIATDAAEAPEA